MTVPNTAAPPFPFQILPHGQPLGNTALPSAGLFVRSTLLNNATSVASAITRTGNFVTGPTTSSIRLRMVGGGGGGGGTSGVTSQSAGGGGGGAGGYTEKFVAVTPNTSYAFSIGPGGLPGNGLPQAGGPGGAVSITIGATTYQANGGSGGAGGTSSASAQTAAAGAGGTAGSNGDVNAPGDQGDTGFTLSITQAVGGNGGSSALGGGANAPAGGTSTAGNAATGYGGGGSGSISIGATAEAGGGGAAGCIIIDEYAGGETVAKNGLTFLGIQIFNAGDGQTTYTPSPGTNAVLLEMVGGGGGGGAVPAAASAAAAAGGSSGNYLKHWIDSGNITGSTVSVGALGTGGASGAANPGNTGGDTTIIISGTTYTAKGGVGGQGQNSAATFQLTGPSAMQGGSSTGNLSNEWGSGSFGLSDAAAGGATGGAGGGTPLGSGGGGVVGGSAAGKAGLGFGSGGSGACSTGVAEAGGNGTNGIIIIYEFA